MGKGKADNNDQTEKHGTTNIFPMNKSNNTTQEQTTTSKSSSSNNNKTSSNKNKNKKNKNKASITPPTTKPNEKKEMKEYISIYQNVTPTPKKEIESSKADNNDQTEKHGTTNISPNKSDGN